MLKVEASRSFISSGLAFLVIINVISVYAAPPSPVISNPDMSAWEKMPATSPRPTPEPYEEPFFPEEDLSAEQSLPDYSFAEREPQEENYSDTAPEFPVEPLYLPEAASALPTPATSQITPEAASYPWLEPGGLPLWDIRGHWAENAVVYCNDRGILNLYDHGSVKPDNGISREEFAYSLCKWTEANNALLRELGYEPDKNAVTLKDIVGSPFAAEINSVISQGLMGETGSGSFRPGDFLTREEASQVWVALFRKLTNSTLDEAYFNRLNQTYYLNKYADAIAISSDARQPVAVMTEQGFMTGYPDGTFKPRGIVTRGEAYTIISNIELHLKEQTAPKATDDKDIKLIRLYGRNNGMESLDAILTVNSTAVRLNPEVLISVTTNSNIDINQENIGQNIGGVKAMRVKLSDLRSVSDFAYQSLFEANIAAEFPNTYYVYAMLKLDGEYSDIQQCVVKVKIR